jgi:uncharacterized protein YegL
MNIGQRAFNSEEEDYGFGGFGVDAISETHVACVFILDTSGSMKGLAIDRLNEGLREFKNQLVDGFGEVTQKCIDVAFITFGPDVVLHSSDGQRISRGQYFDPKTTFVPVRRMNPPTFHANGRTPMGEALDWALDLIKMQKERYNQIGTSYHRPWIFCITDGEPTDEYRTAAARLKQTQDSRGVLGYCAGVDGYNREIMTQIFDPKRIFTLYGQNFSALFEFLSNSLSAYRDSSPDGGSKVEVTPHNDVRPFVWET